MAVCNMDCFHCKFPDCINDDPETPAERKARRKDSYYDSHRHERIVYQQKYVEDHREEFLSYQKEYYRRHSIRKRQASRERYQKLKAEDPDFLKKERERQKAYRERKQS